MQAKRKISAAKHSLVTVRTGSVVLNRPLPYDVYLKLGGQLVLFRKAGDVIKADRAKQLKEHAGDGLLFIPAEQKGVHQDSLRELVRDPNVSTQDKSRYLKESAFLHVHELFTKEDIRPVVKDAKNLVEDMVYFVSSDMSAVTNLLGLSTHDYYTYNHSVDVAVYSIVLAKRIYGSDDKNLLMRAGLGGLLHDIGKRDIDIEILNKTTNLTANEWQEIKKHPTTGYQCIEGFGMIPEESKQVVLQHHENYDGTGYPNQLEGENISKLSRVVTIADVFDALTTKRSYHIAVSPIEALSIMHGMQPGKFDPGIFKSFDKRFQSKPDVVLPKEFDPCSAAHSRLRKK